MMKQAIRLKIHQPSAHFRIPFSFQRRFTYPVPPLSTIKGFLCNLLGIKDENSELFRKMFSGLSVAAYNRYQSIVTEYVWLRNLEAASHRKKFYTNENRISDFIPQHPGGQMPGLADVLHETDLLLYIVHNDPDFQQELIDILKNPASRNTAVHLGRSEDWLVFEETGMVELHEGRAGKIPYFCWVPSPENVNRDYLPESMRPAYPDFYNSVDGNIFRLPLFYIIKNNQRIFNQNIEARLFEGGGLGGRYDFFVDPGSDNLPVIFNRIQRD